MKFPFAKHLLFSAGLAAVMAQAPSALAAEVTWWAPNWDQQKAEDLAKKFEKANPGTTINLQITTSQGLQNRILIALRSGNPPDLIDSANGWNIPFALTGKLMPLDAAVKKAGIDLGDFLPAALGTAKADGKLYGLPFRAEAHAVIYNKDAYKAAGLDPDNPPQTWKDLIAAAKKLTGKNASGQMQYGFGIAGGGEVSNTVFRSLPFLWMNGGGILSKDMKSVIVNDPKSVEAVKFYTDMLTSLKVAPPSTLENDGTALRHLFDAGTIVQYQSGQFDLPAIHKENPKLNVGVMKIPHPEGKQTAAILGGWNFVIPADAKHKDAAVKLMAFLAEPENMGYYTDTFPARQSAMKLKRFQDPELEPFKEMLQFARPQPPAKNWIQITQSYFDHIQEVLTGDASPKQAMDEAASDMKSLLNQ